MDERKSARDVPKPQPGKAEIAPIAHPHLTETTWIEDMIYFAGVCLGQECGGNPPPVDPPASKPDKKRAA